MKKTLLALFLLAIFIFLSFNKHSKDNYKGYHSVIWADGAGYYVYNPMWFIYGNNSENFPKDIIEKTGNGFSFDSVSKKVIVKYTSGIAFLQMPFFLTAHFLASPLGFPADGFSKIYFGGIMIAACLYGLLGLIFSFMFLRHYFSGWHSFITVAVFFLATNLYYYMIDASGMLHVYAFFLFSAIAYLTVKIYEQPSFRNIFFLILCFALAVLIRPTNILLIIFILFFGMKNFRERVLFFRKNIFYTLISILIASLLFIPQLIYWSQSFHNAVVYSYGNESFIYKFSPKLLEVWLSPNNGLFPYAPILFFSITGIIFLIMKKNVNGIIIGGIFLLATYIFSSWWNYWFGCSLGARSFVEYYPLLMFPFAFLISEIKNKFITATVYVFCLACIFINFDIIYYYDGCFYGSDWDWNSYFKLLTD